MFVSARDSVRLRGLALWCAATAGATGVLLASLPALAAVPRLMGSRPAFAEVLVTACAATSVVAAGWLWAITTDVVVGVLRARADGVRRPLRRTGPLRLLLLAACGVVALSSPASADDRQPGAPPSLAGLPLPDRPTGDAAPPADRTDRTDRADRADRSGRDLGDSRDRVRVRPGDSLWSIAETRLGPRATVVELVDYWHRTYELNLAVIGPDPDLILPGQLLELPPTR
ncbi:LysM peptidoglycan-binding domain-containing protein [Nocardioides pelophilus]|uniref:LysM peptidoglycan-binding domain-containing protein n=1 Tax=Nocardioides pelophilus TaxID=2172019 RepID=UPI001602E0C6|nr:LysM peptidoglycan-binding domain-containing protein [Nocardioides pelophilus]